METNKTKKPPDPPREKRSEHDWMRAFEAPGVSGPQLMIAPDGLFVVAGDALLRTKRPATFRDVERFLSPHKSGTAQPLVRIPWVLLRQAETLFRDVWKREEREDVLVLWLYYEVSRYELACPRILSAGATHVEYQVPEPPSDAVHFGSFHSHADEARHSSTDARDDRMSPGIHVVIGGMEYPISTLHCVASDGLECFPINPLDVFEVPAPPEIPPEWLDRPRPPRTVSSPTPRHPKGTMYGQSPRP